MGLRLLPWILAFRREYKAPEMFDCERCQAGTTRDYRRGINCGYERPCDRRGPGAALNVPFRFPTPQVDECPGWLIRLPQVWETQVAYFWAEKGELRTRYPDGRDLTVLMDHVQVLSSEQARVEAWLVTPPEKR